jgi:cytochrome P450
VLLPAIALVQRDRRFHGSDARAFRPERWLDGSSPPYTWIPFGGGVRRCIGAAFAQLEMKVVMREVLDRVSLAQARPGDEGARMSGVILQPRRGGEVIVRERLTPKRRERELASAA